MPPSPDGDRLVNGIAIFLMKGGVHVDREMAEPAGGWLRIRGYRWASLELDEYTSDFGTREDLLWWLNRSYIARDLEDAQLFRLRVSHPNERVFHGKRSSQEDFFFAYIYMFDQMYVRVPFTDFQASVLKELNIAPSQLHPNGWAAVQAFTTLCAAVGLIPMVRVFLQYFNVRPVPRRGWVSLSSVNNRTLVKPFAESFKNFKTRYFKVIIKESGKSEFFDATSGPRFPFYWTEDPPKIKAFGLGLLNADERDVVRAINDLPRRLSACGFVDALKYEDYDQIAFGMLMSGLCFLRIGCMMLPETRKTGWLASANRRKGSSSSNSIDHPSASSSHAPRVKIPTAVCTADLVTVVIHPDEVVAIGRVHKKAQLDPVHITVVQSSESPLESVAPLERKRKSREEGKSSSKRSRRGGSSSLVPLPAGVFDPAFDAASRVDFRPSSSQQVRELIGAVVELFSRGVMLTWKARDMGAGREGRDLLRELAEEQEASAGLRRQVETLTKDHEGCGENQSKLETDLDERSLQLTTANQLVEDAKLREESLIEEVKKLKLEVRRLGRSGEELAEQSDRLSQELLAANAEKERLSAELVSANETLTNLDATVGFNKAMRQTAFLLKVDPVAVGFDLYQDVYGGKKRPVEVTLMTDVVGVGATEGEMARTDAGPSGACQASSKVVADEILLIFCKNEVDRETLRVVSVCAIDPSVGWLPLIIGSPFPPEVIGTDPGHNHSSFPLVKWDESRRLIGTDPVAL
ncbi:hypothetical protein V8G54_012894 [Vigna mungo]|uniref:Transposase (putative) gypsy type domain-containing protein n=1 Tax=Vigna mungo TaxID=3915 RepID=A0AAQ3NTR1_VIGMU